MNLWHEKEDAKGMKEMRVLPSLVYTQGYNEDVNVISTREGWQTEVTTHGTNFCSLQKFLYL